MYILETLGNIPIFYRAVRVSAHVAVFLNPHVSQKKTPNNTTNGEQHSIRESGSCTSARVLRMTVLGSWGGRGTASCNP